MCVLYTYGPETIIQQKKCAMNIMPACPESPEFSNARPLLQNCTGIVREAKEKMTEFSEAYTYLATGSPAVNCMYLFRSRGVERSPPRSHPRRVSSLPSLQCDTRTTRRINL